MAYIVFGHINYLLLGAGLCYIIKIEKYSHIPLVIVAPTIYAGYNLYNNKDKIKEWIRN